ncbi:MAG: Crp/Fnr family transcriptional regulator [Sphingomonas sp.]
MSMCDFSVQDALAGLELFQDVSAPILEEVVASARIRVLPRDTKVFDQGQPTERAHALLAGGIRISQAGSDGEQVVIRFIGPGEIFGSVAIYTDRRYPADAIAMTDSLEASWSQSELMELMERHSRIAINMVSIIGRRIAELQDRVRELATQRAERRIANTLLRLARRAGKVTPTGIEIGFPLRRKDIADISGTTLHTASRVLTQWRKAGYLISENKHLTLCTVSAIEGIAADWSDATTPGRNPFVVFVDTT